MASPSASATRRSPGRILDGVVVASAALARVLYRVSEAPIKNWDEGLYCAATQEMRHTGQWLYAVHEGQFDAYYGKPPLINWLEYVSTNALGWSPLSLRLPTALATASTIVLAWALAVRLAGRGAGAIAAALLLSSAPYLLEGRYGQLEPLLAAFSVGAILVHDLGTTGSTRRIIGSSVAAGALCAAAILTKQILGLFPVLAIVGSEVLLRRPGHRTRIVAFLGSALLLSGWWFVAVHAEIGEPFARSFFERHVVARLEGVVEGHENAPGLYATRVAAYAPVIPLAFGALGLFGLLRHGRSAIASLALLLFFLGHYLAHAVLSKTMLPWYPWPIVPVLAIGVATLITETFALDRSGVLRWVVPLTIAMTYASAAEEDPLLYGLAALGVAFVLELTILRTSLRSAAPTILVLAALALSLRTMPEPPAPRTTARIDPSSLAVLLEHRHMYKPRCEYPEASFYVMSGPSPCRRAAEVLREREPRQAIAYGLLARCPAPPGYRIVSSGKHRAIYER